MKIGTLVSSVVLALAVSPAAATNGVHAFRITAPSGATSTLLGTLHVAHPAMLQPPGSVLNGARALVIEHPVEAEEQQPDVDPESMAVLLRGESARAPWARSLTAAQIKRLQDHLSCAARGQTSAETIKFLLVLKSARLMSHLAYIPCAPRNMKSRDAIVEEAARARGVPIVSLETTEEINSRRASIPEQMHIDTLRKGLSRDIDGLYRDLAKAFNTGNFDAIAKIVNDEIADREHRIWFNRVMITERNLAWMTPLRAELDVGRAFVLVGAAHLPGDHGLLALLSRAGYKVTPFVLPSDADKAANPKRTKYAH